MLKVGNGRSTPMSVPPSQGLGAPAETPPTQCSEGVAERNGGGGVSAGSAPPHPDPEVLDRPKRRKFTAAEKLRIVREADASPGAVGALLRREGLYSSHLSTWRRQREAGELGALNPQKRGRKAKDVNPLSARVTQLERDKRRLEKRLKRAQLIIDVQKKISELLAIPLSPVDNDDND